MQRFLRLLYSLFVQYMSAELAEQMSFILSFSLVTGMFILFADLTPKRIGMIAPEAVALRIINPMRFCVRVPSAGVVLQRHGERHLPHL